MKMQTLIILSPFGNYKKGQEIFDQEEIQKLLSGSNSRNVVKSFHIINDEKVDKVEAQVDKVAAKKK